MNKTPWFDSKINSAKDSRKFSLTTSTFIILYKQFALPLMKFIVKRLGGNKEVAEEVFARTVSAAWEGWSTFEHKAKFFTWLCRIALNKIADYYRQEIHQNSIVVAPFLEEIAGFKIDDLTPEEKLILDELRISVRSCLALLPQEKRRLLYLRYWKEMSISQIAKTLGVGERSVEGKIYRAKQSLKRILNLKYPEIYKVYEVKKGEF
jgi:RNA polymerase sigma factor (sigma-70 family)